MEAKNLYLRDVFKKKKNLNLYIEEGVGVNCVKGAKPDTCWTV